MVNVKKNQIIKLLALINDIGMKMDDFYNDNLIELIDLKYDFDYEYIDKAIDKIIQILEYHYFVGTYKTEYNLRKDLKETDICEKVRKSEKIKQAIIIRL